MKMISSYALEKDDDKKNLDSLDSLKLIMSFFIVAVHKNPLGEYGYLRYPLMRAAVPVFFIISSFLFWKKHFSIDASERSDHLIHFVKRNLQLYFFWFIVLLPFTLYMRDYFANGLLSGLFLIIKSFLLQSTFPASWYIMALLIGVLISCCIKNDWILLSLGIVCYMFSCLCTNYIGLIYETRFCDFLISSEIIHVYNSFPVGIMFIAFGKILANPKRQYIIRGGYYRIEQRKNLSIGFVLLAILGVLLYFEQYLITLYHLQKNAANDCYLLMPFFSVCLVLVFLNIDASLPNALFIRKFTTIQYCMHMVVGSLLNITMEHRIGNELLHGMTVFFLTIIICFITALIINTLERRKYFRWLKYSH